MKPRTQTFASGFLAGIGSLFGSWAAPAAPPPEIARLLNRSAGDALRDDWRRIGLDLYAGVRREAERQQRPDPGSLIEQRGHQLF